MCSGLCVLRVTVIFVKGDWSNLTVMARASFPEPSKNLLLRPNIDRFVLVDANIFRSRKSENSPVAYCYGGYFDLNPAPYLSSEVVGGGRGGLVRNA